MALVGAVVAAAGIVLPLMQSQWHHSRSQLSSASCFAEEVRLRGVQHQQRQEGTRTRFHEEEDHGILQDLLRYRVRLALNRRQVVRDTWFQRFLMNQTLILLVGLLLGCCFTNLGQGAIPSVSEVHDASLYIHGSSLGIALATLATSLWCALKCLHRMNHFYHGEPDNCVYVCGKKHRNFNEFFDCHCEALRWWSVLLLAVGLVAVLCSGAVYLSMTMLRHDSIGLMLLCVTMGAGVLCVVVLEKMVPDDTVLRTTAEKMQRSKRRAQAPTTLHEPTAVDEAPHGDGEHQQQHRQERDDFGGLQGAADAETAIEQLLHDRALSMAVIRQYQSTQNQERTPE